jgi:hypothetical protein
MPITDKLGFGISITFLSIYIILCPVINIMGNGPVAKPISNECTLFINYSTMQSDLLPWSQRCYKKYMCWFLSCWGG